MTEAIKITMHGRTVGFMVWNSRLKKALFEYDRSFIASGINIAPLTMPINSVRSQSGLSWSGNTDKLYRGLPPTFSDSLPDKWGSLLFKEWIKQQNISSKSITPLDHLAFIGKRAMGALEYEPALSLGDEEPLDVNVQKLFDFSKRVLKGRETLVLEQDESILWQDLIKISTSAGGKRPKAIVAINDDTGNVMSGQGRIPEGYTHYILKYDDDSVFPYAKLEYIYYLLARKAQINMMPSSLRLFGNVSHFLTERFDRIGNKKVHTQTLAAMNPDADSYEDIFRVMRKLNLPIEDFIQLFKIMTMNVLGGNVDDHNKNFSFLLDEKGIWHLAPAYDLTYCIDNNALSYINRHELSINGKVDNITKKDIIEVGIRQDIPNCGHLYEQVEESISSFPAIATEYGIKKDLIKIISNILF